MDSISGTGALLTPDVQKGYGDPSKWQQACVNTGTARHRYADIAGMKDTKGFEARARTRMDHMDC